MNSGQLILIFGSLIILSTVIVITNRASIETQDERVAIRNLFYATTTAKNLFEEIKSKIFVEKIISMISINRDILTPNSMLGPDNEIYPQFDDIDDYNDFTKEIYLENGQVYILKVTVNYVNENHPDFYSSVPTFFKLVTISCFDQHQNRKFDLKQIFSIW